LLVLRNRALLRDNLLTATPRATLPKRQTNADNAMSFRGDAPAVKHEAVEDWGRVSMMTPLILKRAALSRSSEQWDDHAYDVLENAIVVGRILDRPWMWASGHSGAHQSAPRTDTSRRARKRWRRSRSPGGASETSPAGIEVPLSPHIFWIQSPCVRNFTFAAPSQT
jgi:hypothetical protein